MLHCRMLLNKSLAVATFVELGEPGGSRACASRACRSCTVASVSRPCPGVAGHCPASPNRRLPTIRAFPRATSWPERRPRATARRSWTQSRLSGWPAGCCRPSAPPPSCCARAFAMALPGLAVRIRVLWARIIPTYSADALPGQLPCPSRFPGAPGVSRNDCHTTLR